MCKGENPTSEWFSWCWSSDLISTSVWRRPLGAGLEASWMTWWLFLTDAAASGCTQEARALFPSLSIQHAVTFVKESFFLSCIFTCSVCPHLLLTLDRAAALQRLPRWWFNPAPSAETYPTAAVRLRYLYSVVVFLCNLSYWNCLLMLLICRTFWWSQVALCADPSVFRRTRGKMACRPVGRQENRKAWGDVTVQDVV